VAIARLLLKQNNRRNKKRKLTRKNLFHHKSPSDNNHFFTSPRSHKSLLPCPRQIGVGRLSGVRTSRACNDLGLIPRILANSSVPIVESSSSWFMNISICNSLLAVNTNQHRGRKKATPKCGLSLIATRSTQGLLDVLVQFFVNTRLLGGGSTLGRNILGRLGASLDPGLGLVDSLAHRLGCIRGACQGRAT